MANLLPTIDRQDVKRAYNMRRLVVAGVLATVLVLVAIAMLIPSYVASSNNRETTEENLARVEADLSGTDLTEAKTQIEETNKKLEMLAPAEGGAANNVRSLFVDVISLKNDAISLTGFFYEAANEVPQLTLSGTARTRDALARFAESLRSSDQFHNADLPIGDLVEKEDINFSVTMDIASSTAS